MRLFSRVVCLLPVAASGRGSPRAGARQSPAAADAQRQAPPPRRRAARGRAATPTSDTRSLFAPQPGTSSSSAAA